MKETDLEKPNALYSREFEKWMRCRCFVEGADSLREHDKACMGAPSKAYVPKISSGQSSDEYLSYINRALYYNAPGRTLDGYLGLIIGKGAEVELPTGADVLADDIDLAGTPLQEMIGETVSEVLEVGRYGILVDRPASVDGMMKIDEERAGLRPYFCGYKSESIIDWKSGKVGMRKMLCFVRLRESIVNSEGAPDVQYRDLLLIDGSYVIRLWTRATKDQFESEDFVPLMNGSPIKEIPFYFFDPRGGRTDPEKPPLLDLIEVSRSHYQSSADLEHTRFACSLPTPYFLGFTEEEAAKLVLGGLNAIHSTESGAKVGYLEYTGQGTTPLENALAQKEAMMAKLGSRMLAEDKKDAETAETMRIRSSGESATLADIARSVGRIMTQALSMACRWMGIVGDVEVRLCTEYSANGASPQEIQALVQANQAGLFPAEYFAKRLKKVGIVDADDDLESLLEQMDGDRVEKQDALVSGMAAQVAALKMPATPPEADA